MSAMKDIYTNEMEEEDREKCHELRTITEREKLDDLIRSFTKIGNEVKKTFITGLTFEELCMLDMLIKEKISKLKNKRG